MKFKQGDIVQLNLPDLVPEKYIGVLVSSEQDGFDPAPFAHRVYWPTRSGHIQFKFTYADDHLILLSG